MGGRRSFNARVRGVGGRSFNVRVPFESRLSVGGERGNKLRRPNWGLSSFLGKGLRGKRLRENEIRDGGTPRRNGELAA